jgi:ADP-heptose:LPS heptosyltransferase
VERLGLFANIKLASIGSKGAASCIPNTEDCRGIPLKELANLMRASRVVVSPSSGPAHFASLCGTPHIVWSDGKKWAMGLTNKARYKTEWNPFGTECTFIEHETWQPDVQEVLEAVCRYL